MVAGSPCRAPLGSRRPVGPGPARS
jgi:hypothetical protein